MFGKWRRDRERRIAESRAALAESERLADVVENIKAEAVAVGSWARRRYEENHLNELFKSGRRK